MSTNPLDLFSVHRDSDALFARQDHTQDAQTGEYLSFTARQEAEKRREAEEQARQLAQATGTLFIDPAEAKDLQQRHTEFTD